MRRPSVFLAPPGTGGKRRADYFILTRLISLRAPGKLGLMRAAEGKRKGLSGSSRQLNMLNFDILFLKDIEDMDLFGVYIGIPDRYFRQYLQTIGIIF